MTNNGAFIAPNATVVGDVILEKDANIWYGAVLRGDSGQIRVGRGTNIQDNCVVHEKTDIGNFCTIAVTHCFYVDAFIVGGRIAIVAPQERTDLHLITRGSQLHHTIRC